MDVMTLPGGIQFYSYQDTRFKQGALSIQLLRPMKKDEAALNALLPAVLLRGTKDYPDLRAITLLLDDLYGASVSTLVRRVGDYQTTGLYCNFVEDKLALEGDEILAPMLDFMGDLLLEPVTEGDGFSQDYVESEKRNLISTIETQINDKRLYASSQLMKLMCQGDSYSLPRLGDKEDIPGITARSLYTHYRRLLEESPILVFYVGSADAGIVAQLLTARFARLRREAAALPPQTALAKSKGGHDTEIMDVTQAKLCMGFTTPITNCSADFPAMQVLNTAFGGGMTSKLFMNVREKLALCYSVGSSYYGTKGIITVSAGIDEDKEQTAREEILAQLESCKNADLSRQELEAAKEAVLSSLRSVQDSPGSIESYYATAALSGIIFSLEAYQARVAEVTVEDVARVARTVTYHSSFLLKGGTQ